MVSQRLQDFLTAFCGADEDLDETADILRRSPDSELTQWLRPELDAAIRDRSISSADIEYLASRRFGDADAVAHWLAGLRRECSAKVELNDCEERSRTHEPKWFWPAAVDLPPSQA